MSGLLTAWLPMLLVALLVLLLVLRQPLIAMALALSALAHMLWGQGRLEFMAEDLWNALDRELILTIPMFLLCGQVMTHGSTARRLVNVLRALTPRLPGGLAVAATLSCAVDASISGSSIVTMLAIGSVMVPALLQAGYDRRYALGAVMSGGTLGIIIPPSIPMIIYALVTETSVVDLFKAGVGPGLLLTLAFTLYAIWRNRHRPTQPFSWPDLRQALREGIWALMMPVVLLGGIYSGYFSVTESAAVALVYAALVERFAHRELTLRDVARLVGEAARIGGVLFPLIAVAVTLTILLTEHRIPALLVGWVQTCIDSPLGFMLAVNALLLGVGMFMTIDAAILVLAPLLVPVAMAYGYDPVFFGIVMILNLEIGYLTPPVGLNLLVAMGAFKQPFGMLCRAALPFVAIMLACLALVIWQPWITRLW